MPYVRYPALGARRCKSNFSVFDERQLPVLNLAELIFERPHLLLELALPDSLHLFLLFLNLLPQPGCGGPLLGGP